MRQPKAGASSTARGQDQAVGDHDCNIRLEFGEARLLLGVPEGKRGTNLDAQRVGCLMNRLPALLHSTAGSAWRLGVTGNDIVPLPHEFHQGWNGKLGRSHEHDAKAHSLPSFCILSNTRSHT